MRVLLILTLLLPLTARCQDKSDPWIADLDFMMKELISKHKNVFHTASRRDLETRVNQLKARIPTLDDRQRTIEFMRLGAAIGDGHTGVHADFAKFFVYPVSVYSFDDGLFVKAAIEQHKDLIGAKVVKIGSLDVADLRTAFLKIIPHDNTQSFRNAFQQRVTIGEMLQAVRAIDTADEAAFVLEKDGRRQTKILRAVRNESLRKMKWTQPASAPPKPLYQQKANLSHWNDWIAEHKTLYFKYNRCSDARGFFRLVGGTIGFIKQNEVERFVLDLRDNPGGNSAIFKPLLEFLRQHKELNQKGRLFVIIGRRTFSSGLWNAVEMKTRTKALLIGEATGGKPNHFGEVGTFKLPNSGLTVTYSKKFHKLLNAGDPLSLMPDIPVNFNAADYFAGRDPYLQAALNYKTDGQPSRPAQRRE